MTPTPGETGWFPHPQMADTLCYWDGASWTDKTAPAKTTAPAAREEWVVERAPLTIGQRVMKLIVACVVAALILAFVALVFAVTGK